MLETTLLRLRQQQPFSSNDVVVLVTPALSQKRYNREMSWGKSAISQLWQKRGLYDFVVRQRKETWAEYEDKVVLRTFLHLVDIEKQTSACVIPDITFSEFCAIILRGRYKAVFLVAHHIPLV